MKTIIITVLAIIFSLANLFAQDIDYYTGKDRIKGKDYEYIIKRSNPERSKISNINNKITDIKSQILKNGKIIASISEIPLIRMTEVRKDVQIFKEIFTKDEIQKILDYDKSKKTSKSIGMTIFVDFNCNLLEVSFSIPNTPEFLSINPDKIYEFEKRLKKELKFNIPQEYIEEYKRDFNFLQGGYYLINLDMLDFVFGSTSTKHT